MRLRFLVIILLCAGTVWFAYSHFVPKKATTPAGKPQGAVPVEVARVRSDALDVTLATIGTLKANESIMLRPEIAGKIEAIHVAEGAFAAKDTLLISIDSRLYDAELKQAEAALNLAQTNFNRAKLLKEKGADTISRYDTAQAGLQAAQATVELARAKLEKTRITAPFDGMMGLRMISPGDVVSPGQDLASFQSKNPIKAEFSLPENDASAIANGQTVHVQADALPDRNFTGKVFAMDAQINASNRNIMVRALIPNDDSNLTPGMFARISLVTAHKDHTLFVPETAIVPRGDAVFVMQVDAAHKVSTVPVTLGARRGAEVEIVKGLKEGDVVITAGHLKLRDGQEVSYQETVP